MPWSCVRGARSWFGGLGPVPGVVSSPFPPFRPACPALCPAGRPVRLSSTLARWYAIPGSLCVPRARSGCPSGISRVSFVCVCAALPLCPPPPPPLPWLVWRAHLARSRCWALVGPFHAVRAPPRVLPRSCAPRGLFFFRGGMARSRFPPTWLGAVRSPWSGSARLGRSCAGGWGGGGAACVPCPPSVRPGGPVGRGVASPRFVPLPSLGRQQSGCPWRRSGHGGRGPHTAPVRARLLSPGAVRVAPWRFGADSLGLGGGPCSGLPRAPRCCRGEGGPSPLPRGGSGRAPPWLAGQWEGQGGQGGGGSPSGSPALCLGGAACGSLPSPPFVAGAFPPGVRVQSGSQGSPVRRLRPAAGRPAWRGGGEGRPVNRPPRGSNRLGPSLCPPWAGNIAGVIGDAQVMGPWPPYCSGSSSRAAPGRGPCVVLACWCGFARRS